MCAFKWFIVDNRFIKKLLIVLCLVFCHAWFMRKVEMTLIMIISAQVYALIFYGAIFLNEQKSTAGFLGLLPIKDEDKVKGRFMSGIAYIVLMSVVELIVVIIDWMTEKKNISVTVYLIVLGIGCGLILMGIYSNLLYMCSNTNLRTLLLLLPLLMVWGMTPIVISYENGDNEKLNVLADNVINNITIISIAFLVVGIVFYLLSMFLSTRIIGKRDYV